jgi:CTP:molybdopterin cytidylyltransferase MocA
MKRVDMIVMIGQSGQSPAECLVDRARIAVAVDLVQKAVESESFASIIVATNSPAVIEHVLDLPGVIVEEDPRDETFHFGRRLQRLIEKHHLERVAYMGGGSGPLVTVETLQDMARQIAAEERLFVANNFYSVDFCAFTPASALLSLDGPENDNRLGWTLARGAGLPIVELPRRAETVFDVDTPTDVMTLLLHPGVSERVKHALRALDLDTRHMEDASQEFVNRGSQALIAGRVSSYTMAYLERETVCRTRVISEERGMRSDSRIARGEVRSLLGMHLQAVGVDRFFAEVIPELGEAAFIDSRVIWAHCGLWPQASDRFNSDLLCHQEIVDPFVRDFTRAAMDCPIPVVLGGHSLVSGGLYALVDAAWARSAVNVQRTIHFRKS